MPVTNACMSPAAHPRSAGPNHAPRAATLCRLAEPPKSTRTSGFVNGGSQSSLR